MALLLDELKDGRRPRISEREFALLRGCSVSTLRKERSTGRGIAYLKDPVTGRVAYSAEAVLEFFGRALVCKATCNYDTVEHQNRLTKARQVLHAAKYTGRTDSESHGI